MTPSRLNALTDGVVATITAEAGVGVPWEVAAGAAVAGAGVEVGPEAASLGEVAAAAAVERAGVGELLIP